MGPRSRERGDVYEAKKNTALLEMLQWGRAHVSAEMTSPNTVAAPAHAGFNGAALT